MVLNSLSVSLRKYKKTEGQMIKKIDQLFLDELVASTVSKKNIFGTVLCVENGDHSISFERFNEIKIMLQTGHILG